MCQQVSSSSGSTSQTGIGNTVEDAKQATTSDNGEGETYVSSDEHTAVSSPPPAKKKRYAEGRILDQTDCKFGIKLEDDEVLLMSDESELSSLNEAEFDQVKKAYDRVLFFLFEP
ncbi:unnamed protein product [Gongylonema pulchrum]|uniref:Ubiquitin-like domain-containing protein n=1 Tax=Gongylonema pulchrum TaxID=637853 RepID=A0A183CU63_9BILA|nr:unnamed protein product [Gongylonema pulchrum]